MSHLRENGLGNVTIRRSQLRHRRLRLTVGDVRVELDAGGQDLFDLGGRPAARQLSLRCLRQLLPEKQRRSRRSREGVAGPPPSITHFRRPAGTAPRGGLAAAHLRFPPRDCN